jgi:hypothetical protein
MGIARIIGAAMLVAVTVDPAQANRSRPSAAVTARTSAASPVTIVSLSTQTIAVYAGTTPIAQGRISSGKPGNSTPTGIFSVLERKVYHESNLYSNAPMPFMQRLTWSGIALHAGDLPGYPASHGCIRMTPAFAEALYRQLGRGARVLVTHGAVAPAAITHAALPTPEPTPIAALNGSFTIASAGSAVAPSTWLAPRAAAEHARAEATAIAEAAQRAARETLGAARAAVTALEVIRTERRSAEEAVIPYRRMVEQAAARLAAATDDDDRRQADASLAAAEEALVDALAVVADLAAQERALDAASFAAAREARAAEDAAEAAVDALRLAKAGLEPLTVFISRREGRAYARQGFEPVFEGDVAIEDAGSPIGTHVFTAHRGEGDALAWTVVSVSGARVTPAAALGRLTLDPAFAAAMRRRTWAGATLIVSDHGLGPETGRGTDFIVLTR